MIIKLALRKKDDLLKLWFEYALENEYNISLLVASAVEYHQKTNKYLSLGSVCVDETLKDMEKNIYYTKGSYMHEQIMQWKKMGIRASTEVKRILKKGIQVSNVYSCISEEDAHDILEKVEPQFYESEEKVRKEEPRFYESEEKVRKEEPERKIQTEKLPVVKKEHVIATHEKKEKEKKPQVDIVMSLMGPGCGLGED